MTCFEHIRYVRGYLTMPPLKSFPDVGRGRERSTLQFGYYKRCPTRKGQYSGRPQYWLFYAKKCVYTCDLFRTVSEMELFHCTVPKLMIRKRYYVLFLIPIFTAPVTKFGIVYLVQYIFENSTVNINAHFATRVRTWRCSSWRILTFIQTLLYSEIALSRKSFGMGHMYIYTFSFFLSSFSLSLSLSKYYDFPE
jgi:hypothetical protein